MPKRVGTAHQRVRRSERAEANATPVTTNVKPMSDRCRATHDVPYTLRCVLPATHVSVVVRSAVVLSGEYAGATVTVYQPHEDKDGRTW
jgi:hypothetical protein